MQDILSIFYMTISESRGKSTAKRNNDKLRDKIKIMKVNDYIIYVIKSFQNVEENLLERETEIVYQEQ